MPLPSRLNRRRTSAVRAAIAAVRLPAGPAEALEPRVLMSTATGTVAQDVDGDGVGEGGGLSGWAVYADANGNGHYDAGTDPVASTDASGAFTMSGLGSGSCMPIALLPQAGWHQTSPSCGNPYFVYFADASGYASGLNFAVQPDGSVTGTVYDDSDANGARGGTETGMGGWAVYLDGGARTATTYWDGSYAFQHVAPGSHTVSVVSQAHWRQTVPNPAAGPAAVTIDACNPSVCGIDFGQTPVSDAVATGTVYADANGNGSRQSGEAGRAGVVVYSDANRNNQFDAAERWAQTAADGSYTLDGLPAGNNAASAPLRVEAPSGWRQSAPGSSGGLWPSFPANGSAATGNDFGVAPFTHVSGTAYYDVNENGARDPSEPGLSGWSLYFDANNNGVQDAGEPTATTAADGSYGFDGVTAYDWCRPVRLVSRPNWWQNTPFCGGGQFFYVTDAAPTWSGLDFGLGTGDGSVTGRAFRDDNENGAWDPGESPLTGWQAYVDANNNGSLDAGETSATVDGCGNYALSGLPLFASNPVRLAPASGWHQTSPGCGGPIGVYLSDDYRDASGIDFGAAPDRCGSAAGTVFEDANGDGAQDAGEDGLGGWQLYCDENGNGTPDVSEPSTTTAANGTYTLTGLRFDTSNPIVFVPQQWWRATGSVGGPTPVVLTSITPSAPGPIISLQPTGRITGRVYNAESFNGGNNGLANWMVYLDNNVNGVLDVGDATALTNGTGAYAFDDVPVDPTAFPSTRTVRLVQQVNWWLQFPADGKNVVYTAAGQTINNVDFGEARPAAEIYVDSLNDSGNTTPTSANTPATERAIRDDPTKSGKVVVGGGQEYARMTFRFPHVDLSMARFELTAPGLPAADISIYGPDSTFIPLNTVLTAGDLHYASPDDRYDLYFHRNAVSALPGDRQLVLNVYPDGTSGTGGFVARDAVRFTVVGIQIKSVDFQGQGNVPLRIDGTTDVTGPEWEKGVADLPNSTAAFAAGQAKPVAYVSGLPLQAQVVVTATPHVLSTITIDGESIGPYGDFTSAVVSAFTPSPSGGSSGTTTISTLPGTTVNAVDLNDLTFYWHAVSMTVKGGGSTPIVVSTAIGDTTNRVYTILDGPKQPMLRPWAKVLELSTALAKGATDGEAALDLLTRGIYSSKWTTFASSSHFINPVASLLYVPSSPGRVSLLGSGTTFQTIWNDQEYDITWFLTAVQGPGSPFAQLCADNADLLATMARSLGTNANPYAVAATNTVPATVPLNTAPYYGAGSTSAAPSSFVYHQFVSFAGSVWDPSTASAATPTVDPWVRVSLATYMAAVFPAQTYVGTNVTVKVK